MRTSVDDLIQGLKSFERELITKELVRQYVDARRLTAEALKPYTSFWDDYSTRNLIYKDDLFEVQISEAALTGHLTSGSSPLNTRPAGPALANLLHLPADG